MTSFSSRSSYSASSTLSSFMNPPSISSARRLSSSSVYGGAGGAGVRISKASSGGGVGNQMENLNITMNEKDTMQNLNDRLSSYLQKVRKLEAANADLELKIKQLLESRVQPAANNFSSYLVRIKELQEKICRASLGNAALFLAIDNAKLASDDFHSKFESELAMRQTVDADISGLRKVLSELNLNRRGQKQQLESLKEELVGLKSNHEDDLAGLRSLMGGEVNVEVEAAPQEDLSTIIAGVRQHYENVTAKNRTELEAWFQSKSEELSKEVAVSTETLQTSRSQISEVKRTLQRLEIELQSQLSLKASVESALSETQAQFATSMAGYQKTVVALQEQLSKLRKDLEQQGALYSSLLDTKARLEMEIAEYRRLLDGQLSSSAETSTTSTSTRVVTIVQELDSDGNVVSSSKTSHSQDQD